jgi:hypothetical protein
MLVVVKSRTFIDTQPPVERTVISRSPAGKAEGSGAEL